MNAQKKEVPEDVIKTAEKRFSDKFSDMVKSRVFLANTDSDVASTIFNMDKNTPVKTAPITSKHVAFNLKPLLKLERSDSAPPSHFMIARNFGKFLKRLPKNPGLLTSENELNEIKNITEYSFISKKYALILAQDNNRVYLPFNRHDCIEFFKKLKLKNAIRKIKLRSLQPGISQEIDFAINNEADMENYVRKSKVQLHSTVVKSKNKFSKADKSKELRMKDLKGDTEPTSDNKTMDTNEMTLSPPGDGKLKKKKKVHRFVVKPASFYSIHYEIVASATFAAVQQVSNSSIIRYYASLKSTRQLPTIDAAIMKQIRDWEMYYDSRQYCFFGNLNRMDLAAEGAANEKYRLMEQLFLDSVRDTFHPPTSPK